MEKRYFPFSEYLKNKFGQSVRKICIDGGFTCPNRDGRVGRGGCIYCNNTGFNPNLRQERLSVKEQVLQGIEYMKKRYGARKFIVYFQPFSNTYADLETLKNLYSDAVSREDVVGLAVGTRPDCVPNEVLDYLQSYTKKYEVWLEYGLQSAHDRTLFLINRGHTFSQFIDAIDRTKDRGIKICVHVILGLPGESEQDMMETATALSRMKIVKYKIELKELQEMAANSFGNLVKAVVDTENEIMAVDAELHSDEEALLLENGSKQNDLWGINLYPGIEGDSFIEFDSMINLRPSQGNRSRGIDDIEIRQKVKAIVDKLVAK